MSLTVTSLNSGSNGNCYYIGNDSEAVLIDVGISCREAEKRLKASGLCMNRVKAIFITHEHTDHTMGVPSLAEKYCLPVFVTASTAKHITKLLAPLLKEFISYEPVNIGGLSVTAFPKYHDAADPHSFIVTCNRVTVGVFTDIGTPCQKVVSHFSRCHAAFLEANYDEILLEKGRYPYHLKNRIRGGNGHLSNTQALEIFTRYKAPFMTHLFLSHLSENNNNPEIVEQLFNKHAGNIKIVVASRYQQTGVYSIEQSSLLPLAEPKPIIFDKPVQLALF